MNLLGHDVIVDTVTTIHDDSISKDPGVVTGYSIHTKADSNIMNLDFLDAGLAMDKRSPGGTFGRTADGTHTEMDYPDGLPTGKVTYWVCSMGYLVNGSWQLQFQLPSPTH